MNIVCHTNFQVSHQKPYSLMNMILHACTQMHHAQHQPVLLRATTCMFVQHTHKRTHKHTRTHTRINQPTHTAWTRVLLLSLLCALLFELAEVWLYKKRAALEDGGGGELRAGEEARMAGMMALNEGDKPKTASIGGEMVDLYNDEHFARVRENYGVGINMLSFEMFSFSDLSAGGGKGGSLMQFTKSQKLLVKQLSTDDQSSLLMYGKEYCDQVLKKGGGESLLSRFFYHFQRPADGKNYVVMNNCMPAMRAVDALWDLKGCADDKIVRQGGASVPQVHKRWYKIHWLIAEAFGDCVGCLPLGRKRYKAGKTRARSQVFELEESDCNHVRRAVRSDVEFLRRCGLMDYSLIVGCLTEKLGADGHMPSFPAGGIAGQPFVVKSGSWVIAYYIGVIDFLQGWTAGKKVAHVIKAIFAPKPISTIKPDLYAAQFIQANDERFTAAPPSKDGAHLRQVGTELPGRGLRISQSVNIEPDSSLREDEEPYNV